MRRLQSRSFLFHLLADSTSSSEHWQPDQVKLHQAGWKLRYYEEKLKGQVTPRDLAEAYVVGIAWVFKYYYEVGI